MRSRTDVTALRVGDHDEADGASVRADLLEHAHAVGAERLEERELRLHADDVRRDGVHESAAEPRAGVRRMLAVEMGVAAQLDGISSGRGSNPITSWLRLRSTASASRSAKFVAAAPGASRSWRTD
jgi:hypothetical protein